MSDMRRHKFITFLRGVAASWPLAVRAQQRFKIALLETGLGASVAVPFVRKLVVGYRSRKRPVSLP